MNRTAGSCPTAVGGTAALVLALAAMLLAFVPVLQSPAQATQAACDNEVQGCSGPPADECSGLAYLNKFEFDDATGGGTFDKGTTAENAVGGANDYSFTGATSAGSVTVTYTVVERNGKYAAHSVGWTSTIGIDRVWLKAGATDQSVTYDEEFGPMTETVTGNAFSHVTFCYDDPEGSQPTVVLSTRCAGVQPTATVTIDNDGDQTFSVEVFIDNVSQGTITETTSFDGNTASVLRAVWGQDESAEVTFEDCTEDGPLLSTASFRVGSRCVANLPALTYDATISETADDPVGDITLTVVDATGVERAEATFGETAVGSLPLPSDLEAATVAASWDFDDTTLEQTLASGCAEVQGAVEGRDLPETEVKGEQVSNESLPNVGFEHVTLLVLGNGLLALGSVLVRLSNRRRAVLG